MIWVETTNFYKYNPSIFNISSTWNSKSWKSMWRIQKKLSATILKVWVQIKLPLHQHAQVYPKIIFLDDTSKMQCWQGVQLCWRNVQVLEGCFDVGQHKLVGSWATVGVLLSLDHVIKLCLMVYQARCWVPRWCQSWGWRRTLGWTRQRCRCCMWFEKYQNCICYDIA